MASSIPSAIIELWDAIPAAAFGGSDRPPLHLNETPQTQSDASQQRIPYGVLFDDGIVPEYDSSLGGIEAGTVRIELYAFPLDSASEVSAARMALAAKYGGQPPSARAGLDWGELPLSPYHYPISLKRVREQYARQGTGRDASGNLRPVHVCHLEYRVVVGLSGAQAGLWTGFFGLVTYP
jgi:hypothetical protein